MKYCFLLLFFTQFIFSQETEIDSIQKFEKSVFIKDYSNQLNIKLEVSNEVKVYNLPTEEGKIAEISPNLGLRYALEFNYRFLSISLGVRPSKSIKSEESKGKSELFKFRVELLFNRWSHALAYNQVKGFYIKNDDEFFPFTTSDKVFVQLPEMDTHFISGTTAYKLNDNYSLKSIQSQTEVQLKSAGSFIPNLVYSYYWYDGLNTIKNDNGEIIDIAEYNEYNGAYVFLNISYNYTFVIKKWFANISLDPGAGINTYKETFYKNDDVSKKNYTDFAVAVKGKIGFGYNTEKIYFGVEYKNVFTNEKQSDSNIPFQTNSNSFFTYFGYRFKAPKVITKPIDYIEGKIPVLKPD